MILARPLVAFAVATALTLGLAGPAAGANPGNPLGNAAFEGAGTSVGDPGTGKLESLLPIQSLTGASHSYLGTDLQRRTRRSNGGGAMADTLMPAGSAGLANGAQLHVANADLTASLSLTAGAGTNIEGTSSLAIGPGRDVWLAYDATATAWRVVDNSAGALLATNNLADLNSVSTAQANLGLSTSFCGLAGCSMLGTMSAISGTPTSPGISVGSSGTGFYSPGSTLLGFTTNGSNAGVIDSAQHLILGNQGPIGGSSNELQISGSTDAFGFGAAAALTQFRANGTIGSPSAVASGQTAAQFRGEGFDGSAYQVAGSIIIAATGTVGPGTVPGQIVFRTANSAGINTVGLAIDSAQNINVGSAGSTKIADSNGDIFGRYGIFSGSTSPVLMNGGAGIFGSTTGGGVLTGLGTTNDLTFQNGSGMPVLVVPTGSSQIKFSGPASWSTNGSVATTMTAVGPSGAHPTVQEWFTVVDSAGVVRYIPAY